MSEVTTKACVVPGCDRPRHPKAAKGMCRPHYRQSRPQVERRCEHEGCEKVSDKRLCATHRRLLWLARGDQGEGVRCAVDGCADRAYARNWCLRHYRPFAKYGLLPDAYSELLNSQGGGCAICGITERESEHALVVDHDHSCCPGKRSCGECTRGILCRSCNVALGNFGDDPERILSAHAYLTRST